MTMGEKKSKGAGKEVAGEHIEIGRLLRRDLLAGQVASALLSSKWRYERASELAIGYQLADAPDRARQAALGFARLPRRVQIARAAYAMADAMIREAVRTEPPDGALWANLPVVGCVDCLGTVCAKHAHVSPAAEPVVK